MDPNTMSAIMGGGSMASNIYGTVWQAGQSRDMMNAQMGFQQMMSGTAHQREVEDLRAANLNPILSATGGAGASSPQGAMGTVENPGLAATQGISSALGIQNQLNQNRSLEKDIEAKDAQIKNVDADTVNKFLNGPLLKNQAVSTGLDIESKKTANKLAHETFKDMVKKARIEGRTTVENTYEGIKNVTGSTAKSFLDLGKTINELRKMIYEGADQEWNQLDPYNNKIFHKKP